jgi:hypothetical protein
LFDAKQGDDTCGRNWFEIQASFWRFFFSIVIYRKCIGRNAARAVGVFTERRTRANPGEDHRVYRKGFVYVKASAVHGSGAGAD